MFNNSTVAIFGSGGLAGGAIKRKIAGTGASLLLPRSSQLDLREQADVREWFKINKVDYVFLAAALVGGIMENKTRKAEFLHDNLMMQCNVIDSAYYSGVKKLLFLGTSCIYPAGRQHPLQENELLTGPLEPTNDAYAIAKIAGIKQCDFYREQYGFDAISLMPPNLYGPGDKVHPLKGHVMSCLIYKFWKAKRENLSTVECFGDGSPKREFLYVDDLADASVYLMNRDTSETDTLINIGTGTEINIKEIAQLISDVVEYEGEIHWDTSKPNGALRRILDVSKVNALGWEAKTSLIEGIKKVICDLDERYG